MKNDPLSNKVIVTEHREGEMACQYLMSQPDAKLGVYYMQSNTTLWVILLLKAAVQWKELPGNVRITNGQRTC